MHKKNVTHIGKDVHETDKALIMLHGRGASAGDILGLAAHLNVSDYAVFAPQATNHTWYPHSFLADTRQNEPWLSSALEILGELVDEIIEQGIRTENIYFLGFSQGACLTLEFTARHAVKYGGIAAFTGGLIGDRIRTENYSGNFFQTPVFLSTANPDPHVPLERVDETSGILKTMNATVYLEVYEGRPHTVSQDETEKANQYVFKA